MREIGENMYSRMEKNHGQKVQRFSIRKYSFGAASVAVAAYMMFGGAATVQADAQVTPKTASDSQTAPDVSNQADTTKPQASTETATPTVEAPTVEQPVTPVAETSTPAVTQPTEPAETLKAEEAPATKADTSKLEAAIARMEAALGKAGLTEKTASAIEAAKAELTKAQALLSNDKATQSEVDYSTSSLKNRAFVLESMPKASTDKKENKNQDSRNGQAIPGQGESGFRDAAAATGYKNDINTVNTELKAAIDKVKVEITKEEALGEGKTNKEKLDMLRAIVAKAEEEKTKATTAAGKSDATEQELQAALTEAKQEKDRLNYYLNNAENWGAPINNNRAGYGNNPANGVFESMSNGFGEVDFSGSAVESKSKTIEDQVNNLQGETHYGKVTYNWKTKKITAAEAETGALNGWKIGGTKDYVNAVKPEAPTDYTVAGDRTEAPKPAKAYDDNGKYDASTTTQNQPTADGKFIGGTITLDGMKNDARGNVKDRDYYLELGSKGVTLSKEYDVNPNSELFFNMVYNGGYGKAALSSRGEEVSVEITDAYTGKKIASIPMRDGSTPTEATGRPASSNSGTPSDSWNNIARIYHVPEGTSKVKVTIKANDDGDFKDVQDGFIIGGVGLATGPGMQLTTNVTSEGKSGEYGYTKDKLYKRSQDGKLNLELKNVGGVENTFPYGGTFNIKVQVPKGVKLGTVDTTNYKKLDLSKANGESIWTDQGYLTNVRYDEATNTLSMDVNAVQYGKNNLKATGETSRKFSIPFTTEDDYVGDATFKVTGTGGMGTQDAEGNRIHPWLWTGDKGPYAHDGNYKANGLRWSDDPDYYYNRTIYIDARTPKSATVEEVHTDSVVGDSDAKNQEKYLLVNTGDAPGSLTPSDDEIKANLKRVADNNGVTLSDEESAKRIAEIKKALEIENEIGKKIKITLPNNDIIELEKKDDGWYQGDTKVETTPEGKLKVSLKDVSLHTHEGNEKIAVTSVSPVGNVSEPSYANIVNEAPKVEAKKDIYVYKTDAANKWNADKVLEVAKPTATDLEDDRDSDDTTKPTIAVSNDGGLDTTTVGDYTVKVQSTDSEGKKSTEADVTVHVLDLIKVDPTVTTDPTNPSTTAPVSPKTAETPVKDGDENLGKYPAGLTREDLVKEVTRTIKYLKEEDANKDDATPLYEDKVQKVTYKRTATVNPQTGDVTYSDWEVYNEADKLVDATVDGTKGKFNAVDSPVVENYLLVNATDKTVAEKEAPVPGENGTVTPEVTKVLYKEIGSFTLTYPEGKKPTNAPEKINYPNDKKDPSIPGEFSTVTIPHVDGFVPSYNGTPLTPVDPKDPSKGYKVPENFKPDDNFGKSPIEYVQSDQKATVKFVSVDAKGSETPLDTKFDLELTGKSGETIPENDVEARLAVLKTMGYTVKENPFDQDPTFDTTTDTDTEISQNFVVKLTPKVSTPGTIYVVDGDKPEVDKVKDAVTTEGNEKTVDETKLPDTKDKAGQEVKVPVEVTYGTGDNTRKETVEVTAKVVKGNPQIIPVDQGQPLAENSINKGDYPEGATFEYKKVDGKDPVDISEVGDYPVNVIVKDKDGNKLVEVPTTVRVVGAYRQYVPVDTKPETILAKESIDPEDFPEGTTFEYKDKDNNPVDTKTTGDKDVVVVAKLNGEPIAEIPAKVTVVGPKTQYVVANPKNTQPTPADSLVDKEKYSFPDNATFEYKEKVDTTTPGVKDVTVLVKTKVEEEPGKEVEETIVEVPAKVKVVQGNPQIIPVDQGQPLAENSINKGDYPEDATFEYEKVNGEDPVKISEPGDYPVNVIVKDKDGNKLVEVPTTVRVVGAYRQYVPVDTKPETILAKENIDPEDFPEGTTFDYKTPVNTSTPGDKDVVVVAKLKNGETIAEIPAKVTVVGPKTQYVVANPDNTQPTAADSLVDKEKYSFPDKATFEYKEKVDTTTPGEKDVTVLVKTKVEEETGKEVEETIVEVPAKVKVVQGYPQIIPVDQGQPLPENSVNTEDYPKGATFEYEKVDGKDPVNISEAGDYPVNVIVKDKDGNELVKVPTTVRVVDAYRQYVPVNTDPTKVVPAENIVPTDFPEGTTFEYKTPVNTNTPGDKDVVVVAKLKNGETIAEIPAKVTVVGPKTQYVVANPKNTQPDVSKSVDPSVFPEEAKAKVGYKEDVDTKTPGIKDVTVVVKDKDGDSIVEVPAKVIVVQGKEQEVTVNPDKAPDAKDNINPKDFPEEATFTFKEQPDTKTPGKKNVIVVVRDKDGNLLVEVPAVVNVVERKEEPQTPKESVTVTPIVVEVGTPITTEDVKGHVKLPKDAEIIEVDEIPTTETPGVKPSVKVKVKLPTGEIVVVEVPVTVIPKRIPETNPYNGDGYNGGGNGGSNYRPTPQPAGPTTPEQPATPAELGQPATPNQTQPAAPAQADATVETDTVAKPVTPKYVDGQKELPNTGTEANASLAALGLLGALSGFGLLSRKKKED